MQWLKENIPTVCVCAVLLFAIILAVIKIIKNRKSGKTSCGCGCENCAIKDSCNK